MSTVKANFFLDSAGGNTAQINGITPALSSQAQAEAGTDNTTLMTPLRLRNALNATGSAPVYACRAWVNFNGTGTVAIRASGNVSSITDNGVGNYTINFSAAMPDTNYAFIGTASLGAGTAPNMILTASDTDTKTTSSVQVRTGSTSPSATAQDGVQVSVAIFR